LSLTDRERIRFDVFEVDLQARQLSRSGQKVKLQDLPFGILTMLLENPGRLVTREELRQKLWPKDTFVDFEAGLNTAIRKLRNALGDDTQKPRFVETVPRHGYRFIAQTEVTALSHDSPATTHAGSPLDARRASDKAQRGWNSWRVATIAALALVVLAVVAALWPPPAPRPSDPSQWAQLTKFPDSVSQPALSPDGRMLAFVRGDSTFFGPGQVYIKILPDGDPVQLTHDSLNKMSPTFSPDGTRIAYTTVDQGFSWDTWVAPVPGGEPQKWLKNASGLVWTSPRQILFSEMKVGLHMGVVAAGESRMGPRDLYLPESQMSMAHRSYPSPDGRWVLVVEMDDDHLWLPCRLVPMDGSSAGYRVGPPGGGCTVGAWSRDGKWMYFTSNAVGAIHIWRQRFPNGQPEQFTSGPTEEEGIAMAPDGRSFVTAVALQNASLWVHDANGERQISSLEGNAADPKFTPDGRKLLYRMAREPTLASYRDPGEVRVADLESGRSEPLVPGFLALDYDISADGRQVVMETTDGSGKPQVWLAPLDRSAPPRQIPNVAGAQPKFLPGGEILFRRTEGSARFVYRIRPDGTGMRKAIEQPILIMSHVSPDGRWLTAWAPLHGDGPPASQAFSLGGGPPVTIAGTMNLSWSLDGRSSFLHSNTIAVGRTYIVPLPPGKVLPQIPAGGFRSEQDLARLPGARRIDAVAAPGPSSDVYAFYRGATQRNLYRIPIP
jgi:DNA-binding winged helix-turn-helix (wHTH) protein/Tol biopolymer transport system component